MIGSKMYLFVLTCFSTIALDVGLVSSLNSSLILKLVNHGDSVTLNCYLGDNIGNNWIYNNAAIISTKSYKLLRNNSLEIKNVDYIHQGIYECLDHTRSVIVDYYLQIEGDCWDRSTSVVGENGEYLTITIVCNALTYSYGTKGNMLFDSSNYQFKYSLPTCVLHNLIWLVTTT